MCCLSAPAAQSAVSSRVHEQHEHEASRALPAFSLAVLLLLRHQRVLGLSTSMSGIWFVWLTLALVLVLLQCLSLGVPLSRALQLSRILSLPQALPLFMLCPSLPLCPTLALSYSLADYAKTGISCAQTTTNRRHLLCDALFAVAVNVAASLSCCSPWGEHKANCAQQNQSSSEKVVSVVAE